MNLLTIIFITYSVTLAKSETNQVITAKGWESTCKILFCQTTLQTCVTNGCLGQQDCRKCIETVNQNCLRCYDDMVSQAYYTSINNQPTIVCDKNLELHQVSCQLFCRTNNFIDSKCDLVNNVPLCNCISTTTTTSTTTPTTTTTTPTTTTTKTTTTTPTTTTTKTTTTTPTTTTTKTTTTTTPFIVIGIARNVSLSKMISSGYSLVSDQTYSYMTNSVEMSDFGKRCTSSSYMCLGGGRIGSDIMDLVGCGNCLTILKRTPLNTPTFNSGAYWYFSDETSIGFSDTNLIKQSSADTADCVNGSFNSCLNEKKLSWHLGSSGGWRLGKITELNSSTAYKKYILLKI